MQKTYDALLSSDGSNKAPVPRKLFSSNAGTIFFDFMEEKSSYFLYGLLQEGKTLKSSYYNMIPTKIKMGHWETL